MWLAEDWGQVLASKKLPRNYRLVHEVVDALPHGAHAAAGEIYEAAKLKRPGIGYSTVYRALDRLTQLRLVFEVSVPGHPSALYEPARADHAHFSCDDCGQVVDVDYAMPASELALVSRTNAIAVEDVSVTFRGRCQACSVKRAAEANEASP